MRSSTTSYSRAPPQAGHSSITRSSLGPLCILLLLNRARPRPDPSQRRTSVEVRVVGQRSCPCSICARLHVLRFTRPYTRRPQDLQLNLSFRDALSSKRLGYMELCRASSTPRSCGRMPTLKCVRPDKCCSSLTQRTASQNV